MKKFWSELQRYGSSQVWTKFAGRKEFAKRRPHWIKKRKNVEQCLKITPRAEKEFNPTPIVTPPKSLP